MFVLNKTRLIVLVALLSALAGAVVFRTPTVMFLAATLLGAPLLAVAVGTWMSRGLRVTRQMPVVGTVGEVVRARLVVTNAGWIPALLVHARGRGEPLRRAQDRAQNGSQTATRNETRAARDQRAAAFESVSAAELVVPILMPGARFEGEVEWKLMRRGLYQWPGASVGALDPIGLHVAQRARSAPAELLILPRPVTLRRLQMGGGSSSAPARQSSSVRADAAEIHGVRPHQLGESGRRIHWGATARTGELHVIEWEEESAAQLTLLLDAQASCIAGAPGQDTLEASIVAAASVAAFLLENGQRARVFWWAATDAQTPDSPHLMSVEARHRAGLATVLTALAQIEPCQAQQANLAALCRRVQTQEGDAGALLLGSDRADWTAAMNVWQTPRRATYGEFVGARGLAFEATSFENSAPATLRAGALIATLEHRPTPRVVAGATAAAGQASGIAENGVPGVRRIARHQSLAAVLERDF